MMLQVCLQPGKNPSRIDRPLTALRRSAALNSSPMALSWLATLLTSSSCSASPPGAGQGGCSPWGSRSGRGPRRLKASWCSSLSEPEVEVKQNASVGGFSSGSDSHERKRQMFQQAVSINVSSLLKDNSSCREMFAHFKVRYVFFHHLNTTSQS